MPEHKIKKNSRQCSELTLVLEKRFIIKVNPKTVRRSHGYNSRVARKKFFVNERTRKLRLDFAKIDGRQRYIVQGKRHICK